MANRQVQIRRDTASNLAAATPAQGELGMDTTNGVLVIGDGSTVGGLRQLREDGANIHSRSAKGSLADNDEFPLIDSAASNILKKVLFSVVKSTLKTFLAPYFKVQPQGRLTLTTAVPVLSSDVTAATTVYYTPYVGEICPIYDGTAFVPTVFPELSIALDNTAAHTGYHQSGKNFDLFVVNDTGTIRLVTGPAWTSDTARGTGAGTTELQRINGLLTNKNSMTARWGSASGNTITVGANQGTYVGSFRASADGQTQCKYGTAAAGGGEAWAGLWNAFNRVSQGFMVVDTTASWTYGSATPRSADNSNTNRFSAVCGQNEDAVNATYGAVVQTAATLGGFGRLGIGLNSTSAFSALGRSSLVDAPTAAAFASSTTAAFASLIGLGFNYLQALEAGDGSTTSTFLGQQSSSSQGLQVRWTW